jgi:phosphoglycolate phosphatase-like HAD superfamily hydrolase
MSEPSVQLAIFDLDSTLTDTLRTTAITRRWLLNRLCASFPEARATITDEYAKILRDSIHEVDLVPLIWDRCRSKLRRSESQVTLQSIQKEFLEQVAAHTSPLPGTVEALVRVKRLGAHTAVWTNKRARFVREHISMLGLASLISRVYCRADDVRYSTEFGSSKGLSIWEVDPSARKPSPLTLRRILQEFGIPEENALLVGNNKKNDGGSTVGTRVRFVLADFGIPRLAVEATLFQLTQDSRLSYKSTRHAIGPNDGELAVPAATLTRDISELFDHFTFGVS